MRESGLAILCLVWTIPCLARTITVDDDGPADFNDVQSAIDDANDGDMIVVEPGGYGRINFKGKDIILRSSCPTNWGIVRRTRISGEGSDNWAVRFRGTEKPSCVLAGFSIGGYIQGYDPNYTGNTQATIRYCDISGNRTTSGHILIGYGGTMSNCLITDNHAMPHHLGAPLITVRNASFRNCTIANNSMDISVVPGYTVTFVNCIIYNTGSRRVPIATQDGPVRLLYCADMQSSDSNSTNWGPGNTSADPCFADPNNRDFHLKSQAGRWNPNTQSWVKDEVTSPCIDAGDPNSPIGLEPFPNGGRINMGAYGGTAEASKSYFGGPVCETIVAGDINGDCVVDMADFVILARHWLR